MKGWTVGPRLLSPLFFLRENPNSKLFVDKNTDDVVSTLLTQSDAPYCMRKLSLKAASTSKLAAFCQVSFR